MPGASSPSGARQGSVCQSINSDVIIARRQRHTCWRRKKDECCMTCEDVLAPSLEHLKLPCVC